MIIDQLLEKMRRTVFMRRQAYRMLFNQNVPAAQIVMADLRRFCRATATPAVATEQGIDPMATGIAIGRQEVWHHIAQHIHLSDADLYALVEQNIKGDSDG